MMKNENTLIEMADKLAETAHKGQVDKAGVDYINHPRTVASFCEGPKEKVVALLHDVIEDTDVTEQDLRPLFGDELTEAVVTMTHKEGEDYFDYIARIKKNPIARKVKLADLTHNMDTSRIPVLREKDLKRLEKYKRAYVLLLDDLELMKK